MTENPEQAHPQIPSPQDTGDKTRSSAAGPLPLAWTMNQPEAGATALKKGNRG